MLARRGLEFFVPPAARPEIGAAYDRCRAIVRTHAKTFYLASQFLPPAKRRAIHAVYAFCRTADDLVDCAEPAAERLAALDAWEERLLAAYDGRPDGPIFVALTDAAGRYGIPLSAARDLVRGARMDVNVRRYATFAEVNEYCYLVASTVGLLTAPILGMRDAAALPFAIELGRAMQLTNILRDVGEDREMGRIYLPLDEIEGFGYSEERLLRGEIDAAFVALMKFQIARCRALYAAAEPGIAMLDAESRYTVRLALVLYRRILMAIEANGFDVFGRRAYVPGRTKALVAVRTALGVRPAS